MISKLRKRIWPGRPGSKRKLGRSLRYRKPEVKYTSSTVSSTDTSVYNRNADEQLLSLSDHFALFTYPLQGTTDNTRIGDSLNPLKIYVRIMIRNATAVTAPAFMRVMIFTIDSAYNSSTINTFWQVTTPRNAYANVINLELVRKVYYDKVFPMNMNYGTAPMSKFKKINIKLRKPVVFSAGSTTAKNASDNFRIAVVGYSLGALNEVVGYYNFQTRFYFTD